jgi:O-antigen ligase
MVAAITVLVIYDNPSLFFVSIFFINNIIFVSGGMYSNLMLLGTLFFLSPVFFYLKKPKRAYLLLVAFALVLFYYLLVIIFKPYTPNTNWILLHIGALAIFTITQFFSWDADKITMIAKLHMLTLVAFGIFEFVFDYKARLSGPILSSTAYGVQLATVWAIWFSSELLKEAPRYASTAVYSVLAAWIMIATGTRMTLIGMTITFALILLVRIFVVSSGTAQQKIIKFSLSGIAVVLIIAATWSILPQNLTIKQNFQSILQGEMDLSSMGRLFAWFSGIQAFTESPLLGIGNGNFMQFILQKYGDLPIPSLFLSLPHAHNATIIILGENGIVGMTIILIFVVTALLQVFRYIRLPTTPHSAYGLIIGFAIMYFLSMLDAIPYYPSCIFGVAWLLGAFMQLPSERQNDLITVKPSSSGA